MTHIRNRAQPGVSGKGLALACLRPGAEAGGKCVTWGVEGGGGQHTGCPRQGEMDRKNPTPGF